MCHYFWTFAFAETLHIQKACTALLWVFARVELCCILKPWIPAHNSSAKHFFIYFLLSGRLFMCRFTCWRVVVECVSECGRFSGVDTSCRSVWCQIVVFGKIFCIRKWSPRDSSVLSVLPCYSAFGCTFAAKESSELPCSELTKISTTIVHLRYSSKSYLLQQTLCLSLFRVL